jgi:uncharacterized membrane protein YeaQ/YmgE (transglycosylase-associated protein family)
VLHSVWNLPALLYVRHRTDRACIHDYIDTEVPTQRVKAYWAPPRRAGSVQALQLQEAIMSLLAWIILGLVAGFIASKLVSGSGQGVVMDIILGIVGAVIGGWLFNTFGMAGVAGFNLYSLLVAVVGAVLLLVVYHAVSR